MKVRMRFSKAGTMKFIGHLDVMRFFQKAFRRAELSMIYSLGYSPHPLLSFASPLGVGLTSDGEYLDLQLSESDTSEEMIRRINAVISGAGTASEEQEIRIESFKKLPDDSKASMALVAAADYRMDLKDGYAVIEDFEDKFTAFLQQESIIVTKQTKSGETELDLRPWIYLAGFTAESFAEKTGRPVRKTVAQDYESGQRVFLRLSAGSVVNIKPEQVMEAFLTAQGQDYDPFAWQIHRLEMYAAGGEEGTFVTLDELGEDLI